MRKLPALLCTLCIATVISLDVHAQTSSRLIAEAISISDTVSYKPYDSVSYVYNSNGRTGVPVSVSTNWNYSGKYDTSVFVAYKGTGYIPYFKNRYCKTYDAKNNMLTQLTQTFDTTALVWKNASFFQYTYDVHNNLTSSFGQAWNATSSSWVNSSKAQYTFDANNNELSDTNYVYNTAWVYGNLIVNTYDSHNDMLTGISAVWKPTLGSWRNNAKTANYFSAAYNLDSLVRYTWDTVSSAWANSSKDLYTYDVHNNRITDTLDSWSASLGWYDAEAYGYTYNTNNDQIGTIFKYYSSSTHVWTTDENIISAYDSHHDLLTMTIQLWNSSSSSFVNYDLYTNTYNSYNQVLTFALQSWNSTTSSWRPYTNNTRDIFYYQTYTSGVNNVINTPQSFTAYPVPANDMLNIDISWNEPQTSVIALYDMNGRIWKQWQTPSAPGYHGTIATSGMPSGNYIIMINGEKEQASKQITILH